MIDWAAIFDAERQREREIMLKRGAGAMRPEFTYISDYDMAAMAEAWSSKFAEKPKKKKRKRAEEEPAAEEAPAN